MESPGGRFRVFSRGCTVYHSALCNVLFRRILKTQQTLTRDGLGGHLPDMSPLKECEICRLPGPFQSLSKSVGENTTNGIEVDL